MKFRIIHTKFDEVFDFTYTYVNVCIWMVDTIQSVFFSLVPLLPWAGSARPHNTVIDIKYVTMLKLLGNCIEYLYLIIFP